MQPDRPNAGCDYGDRPEPSAPDNVAAGVSAVEFALILAAGAVFAAWTWKHAPVAVPAALALGWLAIALLVRRQPGLRSVGFYLHSALFIGVCGAAAWLGLGFGDAWVAHHDFNGAVYAGFARVIARFGWLATGGRQDWTGGAVFDPAAPEYGHHPPGLTWLIAVLFNVFGPSECAARLAPATFSLAGLAFWLARLSRAEGRLCAAGVLAVALVSPAFVYFGRMVNFEPLVLGAALMFYSLLDVLPGRRWLTVLLACVCGALPLMGWVGLPFGLVAAWMLARRRMGWSGIKCLWMCCVPLVMAAAVCLFNLRQAGGMEEMVRAWRAWSAFAPAGSAPLTMAAWLRGMAANLNHNIPWPVWLSLAALFIPGARKGWGNTAAWGILIPTAVMLAAMPRGVLVHDYHLLTLWPAAGLLTGRLLTLAARIPGGVFAGLLVVMLGAHYGTQTALAMHKPDTYAKHQMIVGKALNTRTPPDAKIMVINTAGGPTPILTYYADRNFRIYNSVSEALAAGWGDHYVLVHKRRGVADADWQALCAAGAEMENMPVAVFRRGGPEAQPPR